VEWQSYGGDRDGNQNGCFRPPVFCEKFDLANCRPDQLY
jgi:hypothetical protein